MADLLDELPSLSDIVRLSPADMGSRLLRVLAGDALNRHNFLLLVQERYGLNDAVRKSFLAGWAYLVGRGFLVENSDPGWFFLSTAGEQEKARLLGSPQSSPPKTVAGRWVVEKELSGGGQGTTSIVRDSQGNTDERYVLKELRGLDNQARKRFAAETRALSSLDHPNILRIVASDIEESPPWYVSEYCAGHGLDKARLHDQSLDVRMRIFLDVCSALAAAHQQGITHRDLKPENILLRSDDGPAVLGDFGICWFREAEEERLTRTHEDIGSSFCRAPELFDGPVANVSPAADIYCLGKLLYWMMVAKGGRAGRLRAEEFERPDKNLVVLLDDARYEHINSLLRRMITEDPGERYKDAGEVISAATKAFELIQRGYEPLNRAPSRCKYCGRGKYLERRGGTASSEEHALRHYFFFFECGQCGHILFFRRGDINSAW